MSGRLVGLPILSRGDLPAGKPNVVSGTLAQRRISFVDEFGGVAVDVAIDNLDGTNTLNFRTSSPVNLLKTVRAGGSQSLSDVVIDFLEINPNAATGNFEVGFNIIELATYYAAAKKAGVS